MKVKKIVICSFGIAFVFILSALVAVPIAGFGYVNVGDSAIFLFSSILGPIPSMLVGGIGSAMSDLYLGYPQYAIFTLFIKGIEAFVVSYLFRLLPKRMKMFSFVVGMLIMIVGYYVVDVIMIGSFLAVVPALQANTFQGIICLILAMIAQLSFMKAIGQHPKLFEYK